MAIQEWNLILRDAEDARAGKNDSINQHLNAYIEECARLKELIGNQDCFEDALVFIKDLEQLQEQLSILLYRYGISLPDELKEVVQSLDRLDQIEEKRYWYEQFHRRKKSI